MRVNMVLTSLWNVHLRQKQNADYKPNVISTTLFVFTYSQNCDCANETFKKLKKKKLCKIQIELCFHKIIKILYTKCILQRHEWNSFKNYITKKI